MITATSPTKLVIGKREFVIIIVNNSIRVNLANSCTIDNKMNRLFNFRPEKTENFRNLNAPKRPECAF